MNSLFDLSLPRPFPGAFYQPVEFFFFVLHFFFVLLTVGSAFFAVSAMCRRRYQGRAPSNSAKAEQPMALLPVYFAAKSLMISFGIAVLLFVAAYYSVPFTGAANLNGGFWMAIIVLLSLALILLEAVDRDKQTATRKIYLWTAIMGLALLLVVPAIFVAFVVSAENPGRWPEIFRHGLLFTPLFPHWLARLLHVYGGAVVTAGLFFQIYAAWTGKKSPVEPDLVFAAVMVQIVLGIMLYMSMPSTPGIVMNIFVVAGAAAAVWLGWLMYARKPTADGKYLLSASLALILLPMLLARQVNQEAALAPFSKVLAANLRVRQAEIKQFQVPGENPYLSEKYDAYDLPQFIFQRSCAFCHGGVGNGQGREAAELRTPPADLTKLRTRPADIMKVLQRGVPGSAMPYFSIYTGRALKGLIGYLYSYVGVREELEPVAAATTPGEEREAARVYTTVCAACHGGDGTVSPQGRLLQPEPHNMTVWELQPQAACKALTEGIRGSAMSGYPNLPAGVRWALVKQTNAFYRYRTVKTPLKSQ